MPDVSPKLLTVVFAVLIAVPVFAPGHAAATTGGPDAYGYVWVDSNTPSPIVLYNWVDITSSGSKLTLADDECTYEISLGFQFKWYGSIIDQIFVCSNGFITPEVPDSYFADGTIPDPAVPNGRIVALGIDLDPSAGGGGVYIKSYPSSTPRRFIVTWDRIYKVYTTQAQSFQIILEQNELSKDGRITIQYRYLNGISVPPLVGIENNNGSSGLAYPGLLKNQLAVAFLPPTDAALPPDQMQVSASSIAPATAVQGGRDVPMMKMTLSVPTNDVVVKAIEVKLSGQGVDYLDVEEARLWLDNGDGSFTPGAPDMKISQSSFGQVSLVARMLFTLPVTMATPAVLFVSYNIAPIANVDDWIGARLTGANAFSVAFPDTVGSTGLPFDTYQAGVRTRIVASQDTLILTKHTPLAPSTAEQWQTDVPVLSIKLDANQNLVDLAGLEIRLGGNATASDGWRVKAVHDVDNDGNYTDGVDVLLDVAGVTGPPARSWLYFFLRVFADSPQTILIFVDVAPFATVGDMMNVTLYDSGIILPMGSIDQVSLADFPAWGGNMTIVPGLRPALNDSWSITAPRPETAWQPFEYYLDPASTVPLDSPLGNGVPGYLTTENNGTHLFIAVDAIGEENPNATDGVAIGFDTDQNGVPTPGADDVFAVNGTEGWHLRYNSGSGNWSYIGPCLVAPIMGNITVPSCAAGFGPTTLNATPHRFYEFAIPLSFLGIPWPIPANTTLRFALASPPYDGIRASGNRSTWPLLFNPLPPLTHFGEIMLVSGPRPNRPPALDWVGDLGYETDGLEPETGTNVTSFLWRISYSDPDNNPPAVGQPKAHILKGGVELAGGPFRMYPEDPRDRDYRDGKTYYMDLYGLECSSLFSYYFTARDSRGLTNMTLTKPGPIVYCPDQPPVLVGGSVSPVQGVAGDTFTYRVMYQDPEGLAPTSANVFLFIGDVNLTSLPLMVMDWVGNPGNYAVGAILGASIILGIPALNYSFQFNASDNNHTVYTTNFFGPYVLALPPHILSAAGKDLASSVVNEGARLVPFLQILLFTSSKDINVTGIRVDRVGTASDADVSGVLLYNDLDKSDTLTAPDQLLGALVPSSGVVNFPVSLHMVQYQSLSLLVLVNVTRPATADGTIGLDIVDPSYIAVESGDYLQTFTPMRSTRALINVAPEATGLTVDGYAGGSDGIGHIHSDTPVLAWQFHDDNIANIIQVAHNASVSAVSPPSLLFYSNITESATSVVYAGSPLSRGTTFLLRVSVFDGRMWSVAAEVYFRTNTPPSAPLPFSPANSSTDLNPNVTLVWQPVTDADGDPVAYHYWISEDQTFSTSVTGTTVNPGVTLSLSLGKTYFWKVGVTDGWEYRGNATLWQFSTSGLPPSERGEVKGRVMNGTTPLQSALVELIANGTVVRANVTGTNGLFRFMDLDLRLYTVRASAYGFKSRTVSAEPSENQTVVDLGDIALEPIGSGNGGGDGGGEGPSTVPLWIVVLSIALAVALGSIVTVLVLFHLRRRQEEKEETGESEKTDEAPAKKDDSGEAEKK